MKKTLFVLTNFLIIISVSAQITDLHWVKSMGDINNDSGSSLVIDNSDNIYTTGLFRGIVDFDPGVGVYNLTAAPEDRADIFISKLDKDGNLLWAKSFGGVNNNEGRSIVIDSHGNVYSTGKFSGITDFDPGPNTYNITSSGWWDDTYISKLDSNGHFVCAKSFGGTGSVESYSISIDNHDNVYTTGRFSGTVDFDSGENIFNLTAYYSDTFISKLDTNGNFVWAKSMEGTNSNSGSSIAIDSNNNVYTTGSFYDNVDFDPEEGTYNLSSVGGYDIFIHQLGQNLMETDDVILNEKLLLHPNPVKDRLVIENSEFKITSVSIADISGKIIYSSNQFNSNKIEIDFTKFQKGVYFLTTEFDGKTSITEKVLKR